MQVKFYNDNFKRINLCQGIKGIPIIHIKMHKEERVTPKRYEYTSEEE